MLIHSSTAAVNHFHLANRCIETLFVLQSYLLLWYFDAFIVIGKAAVAAVAVVALVAVVVDDIVVILAASIINVRLKIPFVQNLVRQ